MECYLSVARQLPASCMALSPTRLTWYQLHPLNAIQGSGLIWHSLFH